MSDHIANEEDSLTLDWTRGEITAAEAKRILKHAASCVDYVLKMLPNSYRPPHHWSDFMDTVRQQLMTLQFWLKK